MDLEQELEGMIEDYGLQTVLETIAGICQAKEWHRAARAVQKTAESAAIESVS